MGIIDHKLKENSEEKLLGIPGMNQWWILSD